MEIINQEKNSNISLAPLNRDLLNLYKSSFSNLKDISIENNNLIYKEQKFDLGNFRLNHLSTMIYEMPAQEFFNIVKIIADIENNIYNEEYYLFTINSLISKNNLTEEEKDYLLSFVEKYLNLKNYEDFLFGTTNLTLSKYRQIVNNVLYLSNPNNLSEGQKIITDKILTQNENVGGRSNSYTRVLKNPDAPNIISDDDQGFSKAGFASIILIIYTLINAAIILAIQLIK